MAVNIKKIVFSGTRFNSLGVWQFCNQHIIILDKNNKTVGYVLHEVAVKIK